MEVTGRTTSYYDLFGAETAEVKKARVRKLLLAEIQCYPTYVERKAALIERRGLLPSLTIDGLPRGTGISDRTAETAVKIADEIEYLDTKIRPIENALNRIESEEYRAPVLKHCVLYGSGSTKGSWAQWEDQGFSKRTLERYKEKFLAYYAYETGCAALYAGEDI